MPNRKSEVGDRKSSSNPQSAGRLIVITGFMGAGKTSVARALAQRLGCAAVDLDDFIAARTGRTPQEIIDTDGEAGFRAIETRALGEVLDECEARNRALNCNQTVDEKLANKDEKSAHEDGALKNRNKRLAHEDEKLTDENFSCVIALGGGAWMIERNRRLINERHCLTVWLDAPFKVCWRRIQREDADLRLRPFARDYAAARALHKSRQKVYALAALHLKLYGTESAEELAAHILELSTSRGVEEKKTTS